MTYRPLDPEPYTDEMSNIGPVRLAFDSPQVGIGSVFAPREGYEQDRLFYANPEAYRVRAETQREVIDWLEAHDGVNGDTIRLYRMAREHYRIAPLPHPTDL